MNKLGLVTAPFLLAAATMNRTLIIFGVLIIMLLSTTIATITIPRTAYAQTINATSSILTLNAQNIDDAINNQDRLTNIAKLHNATVPELNIMTSGHNLLVCVNNLLAPNIAITNSYLNLVCDGPITDMVIHHELGDNQTMINIAHAYLKARGIQ